MFENLRSGINSFTRAELVRAKRVPVSKRSIGKAGSFTISLQQLVNDIEPLPPYSIVIGGCEDGMHLYVTLDDPRPGSIMIVGDRGSGKQRLLESMLASAVFLNTPRHLRYAVISANLNRFNGYRSEAHCYAALEPGGEACKLIHELTNIFAQRWAGQGSNSPILLLIEDLSRVCKELDKTCVDDLMWLAQHGPQTHIWPVVTLHAEDFPITDEHTIESFKTYLLGRIASQEIAQAFTGAGVTFAGELAAGAEFSVLFDDQWQKFCVPIIER